MLSRKIWAFLEKISGLIFFCSTIVDLLEEGLGKFLQDFPS